MPLLLRSLQVWPIVRAPLPIVLPHWQKERCKSTLKPPKSKCQKGEHNQRARCASAFRYVSYPCAIKLASRFNRWAEISRCDPGRTSDERLAPTIGRNNDWGRRRQRKSTKGSRQTHFQCSCHISDVLVEFDFKLSTVASLVLQTARSLLTDRREERGSPKSARACNFDVRSRSVSQDRRIFRPTCWEFFSFRFERSGTMCGYPR